MEGKEKHPLVASLTHPITPLTVPDQEGNLQATLPPTRSCTVQASYGQLS